MKVSSIIIAALLGTMTFQEVQAVQLEAMRHHHHSLAQAEPAKNATTPAAMTKAAPAAPVNATAPAAAAAVKKDAAPAAPSTPAGKFLTDQEIEQQNE